MAGLEPPLQFYALDLDRITPALNCGTTYGEKMYKEKPDEQVIQQLLARFPDGEIVPIATVHEGLSGACVLLVDIKAKRRSNYDGLAFAKIDRKERCKQEYLKHSRVRRSSISKFVPTIIGDGPTQFIEGWSVVFYQIANETFQHAQSLSKIVASNDFITNQVAEQIHLLLQQVLSLWHDVNDLRRYSKLQSVPEQLRKLVNIGGKNRVGVLEDRARALGFTGKQHDKLIFLPGDVVLPNPFAYILDLDLWRRESGEFHGAVVPCTPVHGDLHCGNLICKLDEHKRPLPTPPWLIDFAQYEDEEIPFFDLAYLELDLLTRCMPTTADQDWIDWLNLTEYLTNLVLPIGKPRGLHPAAIWDLIRPIRSYVKEILDKSGRYASGIDEQFEIGWWTSATAAGILFARRSKVRLPGQRKAALLYAARCLKRLNGLLELRDSDQIPFPIEWRDGITRLTPDMITAYTDGLFREQRTSLLERTIDLSGQRILSSSDRNSLFKLPTQLLDTLLDDLLGDWLPPNQPPQRHTDVVIVSNVREQLMKLEKAVLLGEPGSGKTISLKRLVLDYVEAYREGNSDRLPVFVPLSEFKGQTSFKEFAYGFIQNLRHHALQLKLVWLLDSFDEMPRKGPMPHQRNLVTEVRTFLNDRNFVLSCRVRDYHDEFSNIPDLHIIRLRELSPFQIRTVLQRNLPGGQGLDLWEELKGSDEFVEAWDYFTDYEEAFWQDEDPPDIVKLRYVGIDEMRGSERAAVVGSFEKKQWKIRFPAVYYTHQAARSAIHSDPRKLMLLCRNPYTLGIIIELSRRIDGRNLPGNRGRLFGLFSRVLLGRESERATNRDDPWSAETSARIERILEKLAGLIQQQERRTQVSRAEVLEGIGQSDTENLLIKAEAASLIKYGDTICFTHALLQQYFAAAELRRAMERGEAPTRFFQDKWWEVGSWGETAVVLGEVLRDPNSVATWLAPACPEAALQVIIRNGEGLTVDDVTPDTGKVIVEGARIRIDEPDPVGRAAALRVLGLLSADNRPGVGLRLDMLPDIVRCTIPSGNFYFGSASEDRYALMHEKPQRELWLYEFQISRYPITQVQFSPFLKSGYEDSKYWTEDGWEWKLSQGLRHPKVMDLPNAPCVDVNWYEAVAYCCWLTEKFREAGVIGNEIGLDLPTEPEWERAARGDDQRIFPWGNQFSSQNCNMNETGIGGICPVGVFPGGASPFGVEDMSGNTWEWCKSAWQRYHLQDSPIGAARALRGGAYNNGRREMRCASRHRLSPDGIIYPVGFRVVLRSTEDRGAQQ
jgi:formylglycine-generating enzyme required for sulfatase activity